MSTGTSSEETTVADRAAPTAAGSLNGDPTALGLPCFIAGSVSFGLAQARVVPAAAAGAALPVILGFSALVFAALGVYPYASTAAVATGGRALPPGRPLLR